MTVLKRPSADFVVIRSPLEIQGTLLIYLRSLFHARVVNDLYWDSDPNKTTIRIEVADKITQDLLNVRPAIFLNVGTITVQSISGTADTLQTYVRAKEILNADTAFESEQSVPTGRVTAFLLTFPVNISVYSNKTESYNISYKLTKLMLAFKQSLERFSNLYQIGEFSINPPEFVNGLEAEVYRSTFRFSASFYDVSNIIDVAPLLKQAYIAATSGADPDDANNYSMEMWLNNSGQEKSKP